MQMYCIQVTTKHGTGETYLSKTANVSPTELDQLKDIVSKASEMAYFKMDGSKGETIYLPKEVCQSSVFIIIPIFKENES